MCYVLDIRYVWDMLYKSLHCSYDKYYTPFVLLLYFTCERLIIGIQSLCQNPFSLVTRAPLRTGQIWATQIFMLNFVVPWKCYIIWRFKVALYHELIISSFISSYLCNVHTICSYHNFSRYVWDTKIVKFITMTLMAE